MSRSYLKNLARSLMFMSRTKKDSALHLSSTIASTRLKKLSERKTFTFDFLILEILFSMNRQDFKGKEMRVNFSKPRAPKNEGGGGGGGGNGGFDRQRNGSKDRDFNGNNNRDRSRSRDNDFQNRGNGGGGRGGGRGGGNGGGDRPKGCFNCGDNGHFSR